MTHAIRERSVCNSSSSKQQFAFSKASRFPSVKPYTNAIHYEAKKNFGNKTSNGIGFSLREDRFGYEEYKKHQRGIGKIESESTVNHQTKKRTYSYSFGVSRTAMKKQFVDEILKKKDDNLPGPDRYGKADGFGVGGGTQHYTMRKKLGHFDMQLKRELAKPGPGSYNASNMVGQGLSTSNHRTATQSCFPKSNDRFRPPKQQSPAVTTYSVRDGINMNFSSVRHNVGSTRIGTNKKTFIDQNWHLDRAQNQPGPGNYQRFSDFGGMV